jgi:hypothetical protein
MATLSSRLRARAVETYLWAAASRLRGPSYTYKTREAIRVRHMMTGLGCKDPAFEIDGKTDTHAWAAKLGVRTPRLLHVVDDLHDLDWRALPDRVVLKPVKATASAGVYLLTRSGAEWTDLMGRRTVDEQLVRREAHELVSAGSVSRSFLVEELVEDPRRPGRQPLDYKVSMFFGRVGIIEVKDHIDDGQGGAGASWRVFDEHWRDAGNVFLERDFDTTLPPPVHRDALLDMARRVSAAIPRAYVRIDLFDDADGPVLGEVTPEPGNPDVVAPRMDRVLGELWEEAEARLRVRAARAGLLSPTEEPQLEAGLVLPR